jgi:hypothetical protein
MMHVQFHLDRHHERERELSRRLELNRLRAGTASPVEQRRRLTDPLRRTAQWVRLLAVQAKCLGAERA